MSPSERLDELFERALELPSEERDAFLDGACGDEPGLRAELRSLLDAHETEPDYLDRMAAEVLGRAFAGEGTDDGAERGAAGVPPGTTIGRYEILGRLGAGAMGVVYRARDPDLDRLVALKFLAPRFSADEGARTRLRREARAASALDHPNIAAVYEIGSGSPTGGSEDDQLYIAMAYYDGETLVEEIRRGPVAAAEALSIGEQLADGLARAHEKGIVHRDIKPANLLLTRRGVLKILDFGVANVTGGPASHESARAGTPAYMSPEQTRGEGVGTRSDVWAAGVVLYELLAGHLPFGGSSDDALIHSIRDDEPQRLDGVAPDVPADLAHLVHRCLSKNPAERPADGGALLEELRALRAGGGAAREADGGDDERPSIVVLPFANLSADPDNEYFSDGLTDEVISVLSRVRSLRVLSRTSSMRLKDCGDDIPSIARRVKVGHALEGSVRKAGDAVRITARLVDGRREGTMWSKTFDGTVADIFAIQEEVAHAIVDALRLHLSPTEERAITAHPIADPRAYEAYLRARHEGWRFSADGLHLARRHIESALEIVGDNELLYGSLGQIMALHAEVGIDPDGVAIGAVEDAIDRVFALDPRSPRGHWLTSWLAFQRGDMVASVRAGEEALAGLPEDPDTLLLLGYVYGHVGRNADAEELFAHALSVDPLTPFVHGVQGFVPVLEGRFEDAVEAYGRHRDMDPDSPFALVFHGWSLAYADRMEAADEVLGEAGERFPGTAFGSLAASLRHGIRGEAAEAVAAITPSFEAAAERSEMFARELAHCYALAGRRDDALRWLEREIELGMWNHPYLAEHDRLLDNIRGDERFDALLSRVWQLSREFTVDDGEPTT